MKFGKRLRDIVDCSYPEWKPNFMSYKVLKKRIQPADTTPTTTDSFPAENDENRCPSTAPDPTPSLPPPPPLPSPPPPLCDPSTSLASLRAALTANVPFFAQLWQEVDKVNDFFLEKQEDFVIEHQQLCARVKQVLAPAGATRADVNRLRQRLIDFHAKLVILENYSTVNYTGFRKILKKHDKKTGLRLRSTALRNVSATPFFLSDIARRLTLTTERQIADLDAIRKFRCVAPPARQTSSHVSDDDADDEADDAADDATDGAPNGAPAGQFGVRTDGRSAGPGAEAELQAPPGGACTPPASDAKPCVAATGPGPGCARLGAPRTPLLRLYEEGASFAQSLGSGSVPGAPPQTLVDAADAVGARELGVTASFLSGQDGARARDFRLAAGDELAIGFFLLPPGAAVQMFDVARPAAVVARLVHGRARLRVFRPDGPPGDRAAAVATARAADAVAPWPAVAARAARALVEWTARETSAVLYVACPPPADAALAPHRLTPLPGPPGRFAVSRPRDDPARADRVWY